MRRYRDAVDAGQARLEEAEAERLRVRAESARLLERVNTLARRAEEEATKVRVGDGVAAVVAVKAREGSRE